MDPFKFIVEFDRKFVEDPDQEKQSQNEII